MTSKTFKAGKPCANPDGEAGICGFVCEIHVVPQSIGGGRQAGQFYWPHVVANDSDGNMYVGEGDGAARVQRFLRYGATGCSGTGNTEVGKYLQ